MTKAEELSNLKKSQLVTLAEEYDVDVSGMSKSEMVDVLAGSLTKSQIADYVEEVSVAEEEPVEEEEEATEEEATEEEASATPAGGDPALWDPEETAKSRAVGTTSDSATHAEGTSVGDVPPDPNVTAHASDAPDYAFPPGGDVEVASINPQAAGGGGKEKDAELHIGDFVVLGKGQGVPNRLEGHIAAVINVPQKASPADDFSPVPYTRQDPDGMVTVRTRDEANVQLLLPMSAFERIGPGGRAAVLNFA